MSSSSSSSPPSWLIPLLSSVGGALAASAVFAFTLRSREDRMAAKLEGTLDELKTFLQYQKQSAAAASLLAEAASTSSSTMATSATSNSSSSPTPTHVRTSTIHPPAFSLPSPLTVPSAAPLLLSSMSSTGSPRIQPKRMPAVVVVDPFSTGANVACELTNHGMPVIKVLSGFISPAVTSLVDENIHTDFVATVSHDSADPFKTVSQLLSLPFTILSVLSGSELGVEVTDFLSEQLGVPTNGTELTNSRRDKYQMGETVRRAGVRAVKQARVQSWLECVAFLTDLKPNPFKVVLKPIRSAGSDNVYLCSSLEEAKDKFGVIMGAQNQLGLVNEAVVVQEYLDGPEYVVDTVSRDGRHKVIALWKYDKDRVNGHNFVYLGMSSVSGASPVGQSLAQYISKVLDAMGIRYGAGHGEVIVTKTGPCLVEIGARCHGAEGTFMPLADACWGYNQVSALVDATLSEQDFDALPDVCGEEKEFGYKVDFVSYVTGTLVEYKHMDNIKALSSFMRFDVMPKIGDHIPITIDCFTAVGSVTLANRDKTKLLADIALIREWEKEMFVVTKRANEKEEKKAPKAGP